MHTNQYICIECELNHGGKHLRTEPVNKMVRTSNNKPVASTTAKASAKVKVDVFEFDSSDVTEIGENCSCEHDSSNAVDNDHEHHHVITDSSNSSKTTEIDISAMTISDKPSQMSWATIASAATSNATTSLSMKTIKPVVAVTIPAAAAIVEETDSSANKIKSSSSINTYSEPSRIISAGSGGNRQISNKRMADEDDGQDWVSPSNLAVVRARGFAIDGVPISAAAVAAGSSSHAADTNSSKVGASVACITTDFSMQNIIIQMGMNVLSVDGMLIEKVKQWVLRCMACYQVHYDMDRLFCCRCGNNHMSRVSCSIDSKTGNFKLHLKKNYTVNTRGIKYNIPKPGQQGRFEGELLLREDQLLSGIWKQKTVKIRKDVRSQFGEDISSDVGLHINKHSSSIMVGLGTRKNPNAMKGRERRGKSKK